MPAANNEQAISKVMDALLTNTLIDTISPAYAGVREIMRREVQFRLDPDGKESGHKPKPKDFLWQVLDDQLWQTFKTLSAMREVGMVPSLSL